MRSDLETTRVVRSWLEDGRTRLPDSVLDAVLDQLPATPQRRSRWPARRIADMNLAAKGLIAAAAVVAVMVIGINLLPGVGVGPGPAALPSPTPTPSPTSTVAPSPSRIPAAGSLAPGDYRQAESQFTRLPFTITVPDGWSRNDGNYVLKGTGTAADAFVGRGVFLASWIVSHVYGNACQWSGTLRATPTTDDVVRALTSQSGHTTTGPTTTTVGGRPATRFQFSVPAGFDATSCGSGYIRLWPDAGPNEQYGLPISPGQTTTVYVVDVAGQAQMIIAAHAAGATPADVAELDQVVASLRFDE